MHIIHVNKISDPFPITHATNQKAGKYLRIYVYHEQQNANPKHSVQHHKPAVIKCIGRQIFYVEHKKCQAFRSNNCEHLFFKSKESKQQFTFKL